MKKTKLIKPELKSQFFYDWDCVMDYMQLKYKYSKSLMNDIRDYVIDHYDLVNGKIFTISNWELVENGGEFSYLIPLWFKPVVNDLMEEFGEIDKECLSPNVKTANFCSSW